jgi:hypothetical protein
VTLCAPDTHSNLLLLFKSEESEHKFHFDLETPPSFGMLQTADHQVVCDRMLNVASGSTTKAFEDVWANQAEVELG